MQLEEISSHLKKGYYAGKDDCYTFNRWAKGKITTSECILQFKRNNEIPRSEQINEEDFVVWLSQHGWRKR